MTDNRPKLMSPVLLFLLLPAAVANHVLRQKMLWSIDHAEKVIVLLETLNPKSAHQ